MLWAVSSLVHFDFSADLLSLDRQNQMQEDMKLWDSVCGSRWFKNTSIGSYICTPFRVWLTNDDPSTL